MNNVDVGGEVDSLLLVDRYLFVGLHKAQEGTIKYWNMATGQSSMLTGHKVCSAGGGRGGGEDGRRGVGGGEWA